MAVFCFFFFFFLIFWVLIESDCISKIPNWQNAVISTLESVWCLFGPGLDGNTVFFFFWFLCWFTLCNCCCLGLNCVTCSIGFNYCNLIFLSDMDESLNDSESSVTRIQQLEHGMHTLLFWHSSLGPKMFYH